MRFNGRHREGQDLSGRSRNRVAGEAGTVLLAVLAVLAILAIVITAVLIHGSWQKARCALLVDEVRASYLAESGIHDAMARLAEEPAERSFARNVWLDSTSQVSYTVEPWGAFVLVRSTGSTRRLERSLEARIGARPPEVFKNVITQVGPPYPLVVSGGTRIVGNVALGPAGVTAGEIAGRVFNGREMVEGQISVVTAAAVPRIDRSQLDEFLSLLQQRKLNAHVTDVSIVIRDAGDLYSDGGRSHYDQRTRADLEIETGKSVIDGHGTMLFSDRKVRVLGSGKLINLVVEAERVSIGQSAILNECIIVADRIELTADASFSGQIIVRDTLVVDERARLQRPCLIALSGEAHADENRGLVEVTSQKLCESVFIYGVSSKGAGADEEAGLLRIGSKSVVRGLIWWEGLVELSGKLQGAAVVRLFSHVEPPTIYLNWIVDAEVQYNDLHENLTFPLMMPGQWWPKAIGLKNSSGRND